MKEYDIVKKFIDKSFEIFKENAFINYKLEYVEGGFYPFYWRRNSSDGRPTLNVQPVIWSAFVILGCILCILFEKEFQNVTGFLFGLVISIVPIIIIIVQIVKLRTEIDRWEKVNSEYIRLKNEKSKLLKNKLLPELDDLLEKLNKYYPLTIIVYNLIMKGDLKNPDDALRYFYENEKPDLTLKIERQHLYARCDYCGTFSLISEGKCKNCGAILNLSHTF